MKVLIADAHVLPREGLEILISRFYPASKVQSVSGLHQLLATLDKEQFDLLIFDPGSLELTRASAYADIKKLSGSATHLLAISNQLEKDFILFVIENGVQSFLTKGCSASEINQAIDSTLNNEKFFCNKVLGQIVRREDEPNDSCDPTILTKRELEVIQLVCEGLKTAEIADRLSLSVHTINTHRKNIMNKLQFKTPAELIRYAISTSIVKVES